MNDKPSSEHAAKILVIDDEEAIVTVVTSILAGHGYEVAGVQSAKAALDLLRAKAFDLVITDILMPDTDGLELITLIRQMPARPAIIASSGGGEYLGASSSLLVAEKLGANARLAKPFTAAQLLESVRGVLKSRERDAR